MNRWLPTIFVVGGLLISGVAAAAPADKMPTTWDKLVEVKATNLDAAYLLPGASFRPYTKIMLDPVEVDFVKGWVRQMNNTYSDMGVTTDATAATIAADVRKGVAAGWSQAFAKAGYQVVTTPAPDVLRVGVTIFNLFVSAPYSVTQGAANIRTLDAGSAELLVTVRDSESGQVLGRGLDAGIAGENDQLMPRFSGTNQQDFSRLFDHWADASVRALDHLKAAPRATAQPAAN